MNINVKKVLYVGFDQTNSHTEPKQLHFNEKKNVECFQEFWPDESANRKYT